MRSVIYVGVADVRILDEDDFAKMGIERKHPLEFQRGIALDVSNEVADALLTHPVIIGEFFELEEQPEEVELVKDPDDAPQKGNEIGQDEGNPELSANIVNDSEIESSPSPESPEGTIKRSGRARRPNHAGDDS